VPRKELDLIGAFIESYTARDIDAALDLRGLGWTRFPTPPSFPSGLAP
jgi:hypothetical protein